MSAQKLPHTHAPALHPQNISTRVRSKQLRVYPICTSAIRQPESRFQIIETNEC